MRLVVLCLFLAAVSGCLITRYNGHVYSNPFVASDDADANWMNYMIRNMDFPFGNELDGYGYLTVNPRDYQRISPRWRIQDHPVNWTSKYGSLTFSFVGEGFPQGGINERGLAMQVTVLRNMFFARTRNSSGDGDMMTKNEKLSTITEMDVIQYVLDNAANLNEAKALFFGTQYDLFLGLKPIIRMSTVTEVVDTIHGQILNYHWGLCDAYGDCALLEYIHDKFTWKSYPKRFNYKTGIIKDIDPFIVTNNDEGALKSEWDRLNKEGNLPLPQYLVSRTSFGRYANARWFHENPEDFITECKNENITSLRNCLFHVLDRTTTKHWNSWQTVFELSGKEQSPVVWYRTSPRKIERMINLQNLDFSKGFPKSRSLHAVPSKYELQQSDFNLMSLDEIKTNFHEIATLMAQPIEWSDEFVHLVNTTRMINSGILFEWDMRDLEHVKTKPHMVTVYWQWFKMLSGNFIKNRFF